MQLGGIRTTYIYIYTHIIWVLHANPQFYRVIINIYPLESLPIYVRIYEVVFFFFTLNFQLYTMMILLYNTA